MATVRELMAFVAQIEDSFERIGEKERVCLRVNAPREIVDLVYRVHGDYLPNDTLFEFIEMIVSSLHDYCRVLVDERGAADRPMTEDEKEAFFDNVEYYGELHAVKTYHQIQYLSDVLESYSRVDEEIAAGAKTLDEAITRAIVAHVSEMARSEMARQFMDEIEEAMAPRDYGNN